MSEYQDRRNEQQNEPGWVSEDLRSLLERDSDLEVVSSIRRDSMDPAGTYISDPEDLPLTSSIEKFKERVVVSLQGLVTLVKPRDKSFSMPNHAVRTRLSFFKLSPDRRNKLVYGPDNKPTGEETQEPDAQSKRWLEAREAYAAYHGEEAKQDIQIVDFLTSVPVSFVMFQGTKGLGVSRIFVKRP